MLPDDTEDSSSDCPTGRSTPGEEKQINNVLTELEFIGVHGACASDPTPVATIDLSHIPSILHPKNLEGRSTTPPPLISTALDLDRPCARRNAKIDVNTLSPSQNAQRRSSTIKSEQNPHTKNPSQNGRAPEQETLSHGPSRKSDSRIKTKDLGHELLGTQRVKTYAPSAASSSAAEGLPSPPHGRSWR